MAAGRCPMSRSTATPTQERTGTIVRDYPHLRDDLKSLDSTQSVPIILIKMNVCRLLTNRLSVDGFNVLNRDDPIPFPSSGQQNRFKIGLLRSCGKLVSNTRKLGRVLKKSVMPEFYGRADMCRSPCNVAF